MLNCSLHNMNYGGPHAIRALLSGVPPADSKAEDNWTVTLYNNATGRSPPSSMFELPSWCKSEVPDFNTNYCSSSRHHASLK